MVVTGAGPVGLSIALGLARKRRRVLVLEKEPRTAEHSRAPAIWPRTLEILSDLGVVDRFIAEGITLHDIQLWDADRDEPLLRIPLRELRHSTPWPQLLILPQSRTESLLRDAVVEEETARILFSAEVVGLRQTGSIGRPSRSVFQGRRTGCGRLLPTSGRTSRKASHSPGFRRGMDWSWASGSTPTSGGSCCRSAPMRSRTSTTGWSGRRSGSSLVSTPFETTRFLPFCDRTAIGPSDRIGFCASPLYISGPISWRPLMPSRVRIRAGALFLALTAAAGGVGTEQLWVGERPGHETFLHGYYADAHGPALASSGLRAIGVGGLGEGGNPLTLGRLEPRQKAHSSVPAPTAAHSRAREAVLQYDEQAQLRWGERAGFVANPAIPPPVSTL